MQTKYKRVIITYWVCTIEVGYLRLKQNAFVPSNACECYLHQNETDIALPA